MQDTQLSSQQILMRLFSLVLSVKIFHYRTEHYGSHKAADVFVDSFLQTSDKFLEVFQGKYGRIAFDGESINVTLPILTDDNIQFYLVKETTYLLQTLPTLLSTEKDKDLLNIRDELLGVINQFKYLLIFK